MIAVLMRLALILGIAALTLPRPALAQEADTEEARAAFTAGQAAYSAGRFSQALTDFQRAYELTNEPDLLYNIATVHDRLRHDAEALEAYRRYLAARPDSEDRANVEARIAVLEEAVARASAEAAAEPADEPTEGVPDEVALPAPSEPTSEDETVVPAVSSDPGPGPWIVTGVGGAAVAAGVVLLVLTQLDMDTVASGTRWTDIQGAHDRVPVFSVTGWTLLGVGVAAVAGGLIWAAVGGSSDTEVAIGPGSVHVRGRF